MAIKRLPTYIEVTFKEFGIFDITERLKEEGVSDLPLYTNLTMFDEQKTLEILTNISQAFILLNLHPYFPYPFYVISDKIHEHEVIPLVLSEEELPRHFANKIKRLKQKEQLLLNKVQLKSSKLSNISLFDRIDELKKQFSKQRDILKICQELDFYEKISEKIDH